MILPSIMTAIISGTYALFSAKMNGHVTTLINQYLITNAGIKHLSPNNIIYTLEVNEEIKRVYKCERPGFYSTLKLDNWIHKENIKRSAENVLSVTDEFVWSNILNASRSYFIVINNNGRINRECDQWIIIASRFSTVSMLTKVIRRQILQNDIDTYETYMKTYK